MSALREAVDKGRAPTRLITPGLKGFKEFLTRGNIVDLAVAVVIGTAFTAVVTSLVKNLITPLIAAIGGQPDFSALTFTVNGSRFNYGSFVNDVVSFVIVTAVIYFLIVLPLAKANAFRKRNGLAAEPEPTPVSDDIRLLTEIRDLLASSAAATATAPAPRTPNQN
ncbi:large conductance mechanosensitive channel protein MscL [Candidatus Frankia meridionalis]|uniref:Large-conductance mechanosensitive channel n=1 Tax=Candidatus Protofrankia datiscae TaxID=2716812 RepID=F8B212_9ACTN|nr:large conductance mechanosensitive channel protein [Candidatus Protofrankia datiscae]